MLLTGCETVEKYSLTYRLWDQGNLAKWSEPAPGPNLALFETTNYPDVLVEYDAYSEKHSTVKRRAYYLQESDALIRAGRQPKLVDPAPTEGLTPIPVLPTGSTKAEPPYGVLAKDGRGFTLHQVANPEISYDLPVYPETSRIPVRVVLTPFAVAGDTVMVGTGAAVIGAILWVYTGGPGLRR